ncbi:hypothetical protein Tco_0408368 [Tanacetum coccineum]
MAHDPMDLVVRQGAKVAKNANNNQTRGRIWHGHTLLGLMGKVGMLGKHLSVTGVKGGFQPERLAQVGLIRRIQWVGYGILEFLGVGTTFDIFQNLQILYLQYGVLVFSGYDVLSLFPLWSLVNVGTDT